MCKMQKRLQDNEKSCYFFYTWITMATYSPSVTYSFQPWFCGWEEGLVGGGVVVIRTKETWKAAGAPRSMWLGWLAAGYVEPWNGSHRRWLRLCKHYPERITLKWAYVCMCHDHHRRVRRRTARKATYRSPYFPMWCLCLFDVLHSSLVDRELAVTQYFAFQVSTAQ